MINGLGVLGWGVGGIEAEAAMLGQPISMLIPQVVGFKLTGELPEGATATDLVLTVTQMLRERGVVGKFVEFYGAGPAEPAARRPRDDRQHVARERRDVRHLPGRRARRSATSSSPAAPTELVELVEAYTKEQGLFHDEGADEATYSDTLELDLGDGRAEPRRAEAAAGPRRAQRRGRGLPRPSSHEFDRAATELPTGYDEALAESFPASDPPAPINGGGEEPKQPGHSHRDRRGTAQWPSARRASATAPS